MMRSALIILSILIAFGIVCAGTFFIDAFCLEPHWLKVEKVTINAPRLARATGYATLAQLSDTHFRGPAGFLEQHIIETLYREQPDMLFITGDFVSHRSALDDCYAFLSRLPARTWTFGIPGDDDEALINDRLRDSGWKEAGLSLLVNRAVPMASPGDGIPRWWLVAPGADFDWETLVKQTGPGEAILVLAHSPSIAVEAAHAGADLVLAGDTHGAQVGLRALRRFSPYAQRSRYTSGLFPLGKTFLYVNRGIGWKARPLRFFCRPELTIFHLRDDTHRDATGDFPGHA